MIPDLNWWGHLLGLLAVEAALLVAVAALTARVARRPQLQRVVWQSCLIAVALVWLGELAGLRGKFDRLREPAPAQRTLVVTLAEPTAIAGEPVFDFPAEAPPAIPPKPALPVWWPGALWLLGLAVLLLKAVVARGLLAFRARSRSNKDALPENSDFQLPASGFDQSLVTSAATEVVIADLREQLRLGPVRVQVWPQLRGPVAFGVWRPTVALPADFETRFTPKQREAMLAHELAHLAGRDPLWLALADAVCALAWWHPAVWWARRQLRAASEAAADEASALVPDGRAALAESLVTFGRELTSPGPARGLGVSGSGLRSELSRRVTVLLAVGPGWARLNALRRWTVRLAGLAGALGLAVAPFSFNQSASAFAVLAEAARAGDALPSPAPSSVIPQQRETTNDSAIPSPDWSSPVITNVGLGNGLTVLGETNYGILPAQSSPVADPAFGASLAFVNRNVPDASVPTKSAELATLLSQSSSSDNLSTSLAANSPQPQLLTRSFRVDTDKFLARVMQPRVSGSVDSMADGVERIGKLPNRELILDGPEPGRSGSAPRSLPAAIPALSRAESGITGVTRTNAKANIQPAIREFFRAEGVVFPMPDPIPNPVTAIEAVPSITPPQNSPAVFFNDRTGVLFVRATSEDMEKVERALAEFGTAPAVNTDLRGQANPDRQARINTAARELMATRIALDEARVRFASDSPELAAAKQHHNFAKAAVLSEAKENQLVVRRFVVSSAEFRSALTQCLPRGETNFQVAVRAFAAANGVEFPPPVVTNGIAVTPPITQPAIFFDEAKGFLFVRATLADLEHVERAIQQLNMPPAAAPDGTVSTKEAVSHQLQLYWTRLSELRAQHPDDHPDVVEVLRVYTGLKDNLDAMQRASSGATGATADDMEKVERARVEFRTAPVVSTDLRDSYAAALQAAKQADLEAGPIFARYGRDSSQATEAQKRYLNAKERVASFERIFVEEEELRRIADLRAQLAAATPAPAKTATTNTPAVMLEIQFAEITEGGGDDIGLDWLFGQSSTNNPVPQTGSVTNLPGQAQPPQGSRLQVERLVTEGQSATLTQAQFDALLGKLKQRHGVDLLAAPKVTTLSGRQAQVSVSEIRTLVTDVKTTPGSRTNKAEVNYQTENVPVGPVVDVLPQSEGDGWRLTVTASLTEFLGYDDPGKAGELKVPNPGGKPVRGTTPLPRLRVRETQASPLAKSGETVVLRGPLVSDTVRFKDKVPVLGDIPVLGRPFRSEGASTVRKRLYVFVTPVTEPKP